MTSPGARLRAAWSAGPIMIPGAFNALVGQAGRAAWLRGGVFVRRRAFGRVGGFAGCGPADADRVRRASGRAGSGNDAAGACATRIPASASLVQVERTVRLYEEAGVAGLHLEDQVMPKRCGHLSGQDAGRFRDDVGQGPCGRQARRDPDFVIVARTDARSVEGFDSAVERARELRGGRCRHDLSRSP